MRMRTGVSRRLASALVASCAAAVLVTSSASGAAPAPPAGSIAAESVNRHLIALQRIADRNGGNRASGQPGYEASVDYAAGKLRAAGFDVSTPKFNYQSYVLNSSHLAVAGQPAQAGAFEYSPATPKGGLTAPLSVAKVDQTPGCEPADYDGRNIAGTVVLIQRGTCPFGIKQQVASNRGARAMIVYNNVDGPLKGTLGDPAAARIPSVGVSKATGESLSRKAGAETRLDLQSRLENVSTRNVVAQTQTGRPDNVVMAGAHLDSIPEGAGINDNGTGAAGLLESALRLGGSPKSNNAVRFAFWGAEESGLIGSTKYVQGLSFEQQLDIALYLNFDMIGSPNTGYFAYDGDDSDREGAGPGPQGSARIEQDLNAAMAANGVPLEGTDFDGRSDYGGFVAAGIPAGGLFTGAEKVKTEQQAAQWDGTAEKPFDSNYHTPNDNLANVDRRALEQNTRAMAMVLDGYAASTEGVNGVPERRQRAKLRTQHTRTTAPPGTSTEHSGGGAAPHSAPDRI